jgi:hypothetical protein
MKGRNPKAIYFGLRPSASGFSLTLRLMSQGVIHQN